MFSLAIFFLLQSRTHGYLILIVTAVVLAICAVLQVSLDGVAAGVAWQLLRTWVHEGISERVVALGNTFTSVQDVRQNTLAANNTIADLLFLYRCWHMWSTHRHARLIMCIPLVFIFVTTRTDYLSNSTVPNASITNSSAFTVLGCLVSLHKIDARIAYISALITNTLLLILTAGRILWKGRQESLVMDCRIRIPRKHNTTVEIILESSLLYLICDLIYVISFGIEKPYSAFGLICWGSLAQLINIIPMMIIVRAALVKNLGPSDTHAYHDTKLGTATGISAVECLECTSQAGTRMDV
ncbi:hypothetical protein B0H13DRAFT_2325993 [Mycena leptocephala]|nr:hypothetical protein B0H13DRAFT_2325993 [Mycena leptocephala]